VYVLAKYDIIRRISDERTLALFNSIADPDGNRSLAKLRKYLTKKKCYTGISGLMDTGLINQMIIGKALTYYGKLNAIEEIEN
jgi:hypothetical protein